MLAEDSDRYAVYDSIRAQRTWASPRTEPKDEIYHIGMFLRLWMELESTIRNAAPPRRSGPVIPTTSQLLSMNLLTEDTVYDFDQLRRMRNNLVHGVEPQTAEDLDEATKRLNTVLIDIKQRLRDQGEGD
jgi:hypothetical protein